MKTHPTRILNGTTVCYAVETTHVGGRGMEHSVRYWPVSDPEAERYMDGADFFAQSKPGPLVREHGYAFHILVPTA